MQHGVMRKGEVNKRLLKLKKSGNVGKRWAAHVWLNNLQALQAFLKKLWCTCQGLIRAKYKKRSSVKWKIPGRKNGSSKGKNGLPWIGGPH